MSENYIYSMIFRKFCFLALSVCSSMLVAAETGWWAQEGYDAACR